jgi:uncharacterized glyoxalase superfamily protein PhnB
MVRAIPEGAHTIIPHLNVAGAARAIDFYRAAFGAYEVARHPMPGTDKLMHAEIRIGDSRIYLADEMPEMGSHGPKSLKGTSCTIHVWTEHVDSLFNQAVSAGAKVKMPLMDQFWGDRYAVVEDPFGHLWSLATHIADYTPEEMATRMQEAMANMPPPPKARRTTRKSTRKTARKARPKAKPRKAAKRRRR